MRKQKSRIICELQTELPRCLEGRVVYFFNDLSDACGEVINVTDGWFKNTVFHITADKLKVYSCF